MKVLLTGDEIKEKEVETGINDSSNTEIINGLKLNDKILITGNEKGKWKGQNKTGTSFGPPSGGNRIM